MKFFSGFFISLLLAFAARADGISVALMPPKAVSANSTVAVDVVVFNSSASAQNYVFAASINGKASSGVKNWPLIFSRPGEETVTVQPGTFAARSYSVRIPDDAISSLILKINDGLPSVAAAVLERAPAVADSNTFGSTPASTAAAAPEPAGTSTAPAKPASSLIERTFVNRIGVHEPIYFIAGTHAPSAKFEFSFKYELAHFGEGNPTFVPDTLQFAYTQRSLWDIRGQSSPFYDSSYMPEFIFESLSAAPKHSSPFLTWLGYQAAVRHESNGQAGEMSRSLNTAYFRPLLAIGPLDGWHAVLAPEIFTYIGGLSDNPNLPDYRGYGQFRATFGKNGKPSLLFTGIPGRGFHKHTLQWDLTVPVHIPVIDWKTYLLVQYFDGYGESLREYAQKSRVVRVGISLVR